MGCTGKGESDGEYQNKCDWLHATNFKKSYGAVALNSATAPMFFELRVNVHS